MSANTETYNTPELTNNNTNWSITEQLPTLLRTVGAISLLAAMYGFLMKGWQNGDDLIRYLMLLGHTGALAAIGLASGHFLKESKGARLLLSLTLVSVPVNFAILGAFIFSTNPLAMFGVVYPKYMAWSVDTLSTALFIAGGACLVLAPVIRLGFLTLARSMSGKLAGLFLLSNAALLIPVRDSMLVGLIIMGLMIMVLLVSGKTAAGQVAAKTREGLLGACKKITLHSWVSMRALMCNLILVVPCASQELIAPSPHQKLIHL